MLSKLIAKKLSTVASPSSHRISTLPLNSRSKRSFVAIRGRRSRSLGAIDAQALQSYSSGKWGAVTSLFVCTSGWKNTLVAEITGGVPSRHVCLHRGLRTHSLSVFDSDPAAENLNDRNAIAQAATGSDLLLLASHQA